MRKHLSVAALWLRLTFGRVLGVLVLMAAAQLLLFGRAAVSVDTARQIPFEQVLSGSGIRIVFAAAVCLLDRALTPGIAVSARHTLLRLSLREEAATLWQGLIHSGYFLLLWAMELAVLLGMVAAHAAAAGPEHACAQTVALVVYRLPFLQMLLPLGDGLRWAAMILWCLSTGFLSAADGYRIRRGGKFPWSTLGAVVMMVYMAAIGETVVSRWTWLLINVGLFLMAVVMTVRGPVAELVKGEYRG